MRATKLTSAVLLTATAAITAATAATGCGISSGDDRNDRNEPNAPPAAAGDIAWKPCTDLPSPESGAETQGPAQSADWECGTLRAPLDHDDPDGEKIGIAMIRTKATGPAKDRIGSLLFNFGGPGGSGVDTLPGLAGEYKALRKRYDLVSFDPRGVSRSEGVRCYDDKQLDAYFAADNTPDDTSEQKSFLRNIEDFADACERKAGAVLPYVATENVARDMDLMRAALGDDRMHYFGISYGTELGGVYAHLFPEKVGRAVLDSSVDPTQDSAERSLGQAKGFQQALESYTDDCTATQGDSCPIDSTEDVADLLKRLDREPIPGRGKRELTQSLAASGIAQALYAKELWPVLTQGLEQAESDDGATLMALADALNGRDPDGHYTTMQASFTAIGCADTSDRYSTDDIDDRLPEFRSASPVFGDFMGWSLAACTDWPVTGKEATPDVDAEGADPILVVGTTGDPATPYAGTEKMVDALGDDVGVKLTRKGEGHGAYGSHSPCTRAAVDTYLLTGDTPPDGKTCEK